MTEYILLKESQIPFFKNIAFYYKTKDQEYALYKKEGDYLDESRMHTTNHPDLFILESDKDTAMLELTQGLNKDLEEKVSQGRLKEVREAMAAIVGEVLAPGQEKNMNALPDTIEILIGRYSEDQDAMLLLTEIGATSSVLVEHTVNVTALMLHFCFFHKMSETDTRQLAMAALLHDVGVARMDRKLVESTRRLSDIQFEVYKTHPQIGYDMIKGNTNFDMAIPTVTLEHHERLDGSGYPNGLNRIASYSQLVGLIDCYEQLTYHSKQFRKKKKPFDTLNLIKEEVKSKKFAKPLFKRFTACLTKKDYL